MGCFGTLSDTGFGYHASFSLTEPFPKAKKDNILHALASKVRFTLLAMYARRALGIVKIPL